MATEDATAQVLHYDKRRMPVAVHKFPIKYFFRWKKSKRINVAIDPVTNELYIFCDDIDMRESKILVFDNTKLVREIKHEFLANYLVLCVSDSAIFSHRIFESNYSIIKLSKSGNILSEIRTIRFQKLCFSHNMLYALNSEEMFVFDEDLKYLFDRKLHLDSSCLLMGITIKFNVVFVGSASLAGFRIYMYSLDGCFISHFCVIENFFTLNPIYFFDVMCMDSVGSIILLETELQQNRLSVKMLEFGEEIEKLGTNELGNNVIAVIVDNTDRIVCVVRRSVTYNIYIF